MTRNAVPTSSATARRTRRHADDAAEQRAQVGERVAADAVVDPDAALLAVEQAGLVQHLEVVADRRLGQVEGVVEVADARLAAVVGGDQREQPQPDRVGERLEQRRDRARPAPRVSGSRDQRRAAGDRLDRRQRRETSTCVNIDRHRCLVQPQTSTFINISRRSTMSRIQLALNVDDLDSLDRLLLRAVRHRAGQAPARLRQLRRRRAAAQAGPDREPRPRRVGQPPRRRGGRHRHRRRRADPARRAPAWPRSTSATRPAATPSRTSSGSRAPPTASAGRSTPCSPTARPSASRPRAPHRPGSAPAGCC